MVVDARRDGDDALRCASYRYGTPLCVPDWKVVVRGGGFSLGRWPCRLFDDDGRLAF